MGEDQKLWDAYNLLTTGPDVERLRKILVRAEFFRRVLEIPGDIVECGVFKGSGLLLWAKLLAIFAPGSNKKVIGFDLFQGFADHAEEGEQSAVRELLDEANYPEDFSPAHIEAYLRAAGQEPRCRLVPGDIQHTGAAYCASHPGFRISLLHLDFDLAAPTEAALEVFWPRLARGGLVLFDEYAVDKWTESQAVDRFFAQEEVVLKTLPWARTPTAYLIKP